MTNTPRLSLPLLAPEQAQKHITHNEALLMLDQLSGIIPILDRNLSAPPALPADGDGYILGAAGTGDWTGFSQFDLALRIDATWRRVVPSQAMIAAVADEAGLLIYWNGMAWVSVGTAGPIGASTIVSQGLNGSANEWAVAEELLAGLAGASVDSTIVIPSRSIVFGVSARTVTSITGAASYDCGIVGEPAKFGGALSIAADSTNSGVIGPTAFYADTAIRLTANGGSFTGGGVRIAIHYLLPHVPTS